MASHSSRNVCNPSESAPVLTMCNEVGGASARRLTAGTKTSAKVNNDPARVGTNRDKHFIAHTDAESGVVEHRQNRLLAAREQNRGAALDFTPKIVVFQLE